MKKMDIDTSKACVIGWDGDLDGVITFLHGGYFIRSGKFVTVDFGIYNNPDHVKWYNNEGYLPCLVTEFERESCTVRIMNFGDKITIEEKSYVAVYSRVAITNNGQDTVSLDPEPIGPVLSLNKNVLKIAAGQTLNHDYVIAADRFGNDYPWPLEEELIALGGWDSHYEHMKEYWNRLLDGVVRINQLPDSRLIDAYKAGYIYTHIIKDGYNLNVGENGYDEVFDHDSIGILVNLFTMGDFKDAKEYLLGIKAQIQYDDAKWKYAWPWAVYLHKTGDEQFVRDNFDSISNYAHAITEDINGPNGIIKETWDIDNIGFWTVDNWSALMGLTAYRYLCEKLDKPDECAWVQNTYRNLLDACNTTLMETAVNNKIDYIPASMTKSNSENVCAKPRNTNWASMFLFGRWAWDGYLFSAPQYGIMLDKIDDTYDYGFRKAKEAGLPAHSFGGGSCNDYIGSYNAGLAASGLRGERYRSESIYCYQAMICLGMTGPFSWWESSGNPGETPWEGTHPESGDGSCPHMWGQSCATKALIESLIAEKMDGSIIIGRGIPEEWLIEGKKIDISNYPVCGNKRIGYFLEAIDEKRIVLNLTGDKLKADISFNLPVFKDNIESCSHGSINNETGEIVFSASTRQVMVTLRKISAKKNLAYKKGVTAAIIPTLQGAFCNATDGSIKSYTQSSKNEPWCMCIDLGRPTLINRVNITTDMLDYAKQFTIEVSMDRVNWTPVAWEWNNDGKPKSYLFHDTRVRYVGLNVKKVHGGSLDGGHKVNLVEIYSD